MTLDQIMKLDGIYNYYIWWYGVGVNNIGEYFDENGFVSNELDVRKGASIGDCVILVLDGIDGQRSKYMFAVRLTEKIDSTHFKWQKANISLDEYSGRMVFKCKRKFSFYNSSDCGSDFVVESITPPETDRTVEQFRDYDSVELTFVQLKEVIDRRYIDYYEHLSCVKAVYMIIDGNTGKQYVGSAYEKKESLWARWSVYAETCHGNNQKLIELYNAKGAAYFNQFKFIILQIFPQKASDKEIVEAESRYKNRFLTREFGLNAN